MAPSLCRLGRRERRLGGCAGWRIRRILDGLGAARVRGAHYGGGREVLAVKLQVTQASWQTQG